MRGLSSAGLLSAWEAGSGTGRVERPLAALAAWLPERSPGEVARLPIGERDALLVQLHALTFGPRIEGLARCPACAETVEFSLAVEGLPAAPDPTSEAPAGDRIESGGHIIEYRLPDSSDLAAAAAASGPDAARQVLARRCLKSVDGRESTAIEEPLADDLLGALANELARRQPLADIEVALGCPSCSNSWNVPLDVAEFVWEEIAAEARRVVFEVDRLARAYGWREADILALTPARRRTYLAMVG